MIRNPIVSGQFYPREVNELNTIIKSFAPKNNQKIAARGIVLPHAGYKYSGNVAVNTVARILPKKKLIILGPNHTGYGKSFSLWDIGKWKIPFGEIEIDEILAKEILENGNSIVSDYAAHQFEHSIEVELPILHYYFSAFSFVPIVCQVSTLDVYTNVAFQICDAVKKTKADVLFVASTDLTHYESDMSVRRKDRLAIEQIVNLDEQKLLDVVKRENISMCGIAPVVVLLLCMKQFNVQKVHVALYQTSADITGDSHAVVGYGGIIIN